MDYSRIKAVLEHKNMSVRDLCYKIDVTEQGLHQMIRNKSMKIEILERISSVLELPVSYWFEDYTTRIESVSSSNIVSTTANDSTGKYLTTNVIHQKIDSLTKDLNEMLKEMVSK